MVVGCVQTVASKEWQTLTVKLSVRDYGLTKSKNKLRWGEKETQANIQEHHSQQLPRIMKQYKLLREERISKIPPWSHVAITGKAPLVLTKTNLQTWTFSLAPTTSPILTSQEHRHPAPLRDRVPHVEAANIAVRQRLPFRVSLWLVRMSKAFQIFEKVSAACVCYEEQRTTQDLRCLWRSDWRVKE